MFVAVHLKVSQSIVLGIAEISSTWFGSLHDEWAEKLLAKSCYKTENKKKKGGGTVRISLMNCCTLVNS